MTVDIYERAEAYPASFPDMTHLPLSAAAAALDPEMIWSRIEDYIAWRWSARTVVWTVLGGGEFVPNLKPATITQVELWQSPSWSVVTVDPGPLGGIDLPAWEPYRVTATVGAGVTAPAEVEAAFVRLAEYMATPENHPGASRVSVDVGGATTIGKSRDPRWLARAMDYSGAADLLRKYRRA